MTVYKLSDKTKLKLQKKLLLCVDLFSKFFCFQARQKIYSETVIFDSRCIVSWCVCIQGGFIVMYTMYRANSNYCVYTIQGGVCVQGGLRVRG